MKLFTYHFLIILLCCRIRSAGSVAAFMAGVMAMIIMCHSSSHLRHARGILKPNQLNINSYSIEYSYFFSMIYSKSVSASINVLDAYSRPRMCYSSSYLRHVRGINKPNQRFQFLDVMNFLNLSLILI